MKLAGLSRSSRGAQALGRFGRVAVSSRVRLARNVAGVPFPDSLSDDDAVKLARKLGKFCQKAGRTIGVNLGYAELDERGSSDEIYILSDRGLVSNTFFERLPGAGVAFRPDDTYSQGGFSVMLNEEDHIRIQSIVPGYDLERAWREADDFDTAINRFVPYAFSKKLGYLTACPTNVGTAMRASVEVFLPGMLLAEDFDATLRALSALRVNARGEEGEGSAFFSPTVQISTGGTLGLTEAQAIASLKRVVDEVVEQEARARRYIFTRERRLAVDYFARALSILKTSYMLGAQEAKACLHAVRLAVELRYVKRISLDTVDEALARIGDSFFEREPAPGGSDGEPPPYDDDAPMEDRASAMRYLFSRAQPTF